MGHAYHAQGQGRLAVRALQDNAEALAGDLEREPSTAAVTAYVSTCAWLAFTLADLGEFDSAETWADRARAEAEARRHPYSEAIALTLSGQVSALRGQLERAVAPLVRALTICREASLTVWQAIPAALLGQCLVTLDRKEEGLALLERQQVERPCHRRLKGAMTFGMAAYSIVRDTEAEAQRELERITNVSPGSPGYGNYQDWISHTQLEQQVSLADYSVSFAGSSSPASSTGGSSLASSAGAFSLASDADRIVLQLWHRKV